MMSSVHSITTLKHTRPEWTPWLAVVEQALRCANDPAWDVVPVDIRPPQSGLPRLAGASISVRPALVSALLETLIRTAIRGRTPPLASLERALSREVDVLKLLAASLAYDHDSTRRVASERGVDGEALDAVVRLLATPLLMTEARRAVVPESWLEPFCAVCGAWPAFSEVRGIERLRFNRCGRCGSQWRTRQLRCPYCRTTNHEELAMLVRADEGATASVDACERCRCYAKTLTRLQGCPPDSVMIEDLATVDFDVAAVERGYSRPAGLGYQLGVKVVATA